MKSFKANSKENVINFSKYLQLFFLLILFYLFFQVSRSVQEGSFDEGVSESDSGSDVVQNCLNNEKKQKATDSKKKIREMRKELDKYKKENQELKQFNLELQRQLIINKGTGRENVEPEVVIDVSVILLFSSFCIE